MGGRTTSNDSGATRATPVMCSVASRVLQQLVLTLLRARTTTVPGAAYSSSSGCFRYYLSDRLFRGMSIAISSSQKVLESPFSHREMFGTDHPVSKGRRKSKSKQRKTSKVKSKSTTKSSGPSSSFSSPLKQKQKESGSKESASKYTVDTKIRKHESDAVLSPITSPSLGLAKVDTDSPNTLRKRVEKSKSSTFSVARQHTSPSNPKTNAMINGSWKGKNALGTSPLASSHSSLASSPSTISLKSSEQNLKSGIVSAAVNIRFNRKVANVNLPPYMRVPRRAFDTTAGSRRNGELTPLSISDVAGRLGRLQYQHVIVMSGAGVSTPSGIPDFRLAASLAKSAPFVVTCKWYTRHFRCHGNSWKSQVCITCKYYGYRFTLHNFTLTLNS